MFSVSTFFGRGRFSLGFCILLFAISSCKEETLATAPTTAPIPTLSFATACYFDTDFVTRYGETFRHLAMSGSLGACKVGNEYRGPNSFTIYYQNSKQRGIYSDYYHAANGTIRNLEQTLIRDLEEARCSVALSALPTKCDLAKRTVNGDFIGCEVKAVGSQNQFVVNGVIAGQYAQSSEDKALNAAILKQLQNGSCTIKNLGANDCDCFVNGSRP